LEREKRAVSWVFYWLCRVTGKRCSLFGPDNEITGNRYPVVLVTGWGDRFGGSFQVLVPANRDARKSAGAGGQIQPDSNNCGGLFSQRRGTGVISILCPETYQSDFSLRSVFFNLMVSDTVLLEYCWRVLSYQDAFSGLIWRLPCRVFCISWLFVSKLLPVKILWFQKSEFPFDRYGEAQ